MGVQFLGSIAGPAAVCLWRVCIGPGQIRCVCGVALLLLMEFSVSVAGPDSIAAADRAPSADYNQTQQINDSLPFLSVSAPAAEVRGNPTEYYRRAGAGSSVGAGVRIGAVRAEAIRDNNSGKTNVWLSYGERF